MCWTLEAYVLSGAYCKYVLKDSRHHISEEMLEDTRLIKMLINTQSYKMYQERSCISWDGKHLSA